VGVGVVSKYGFHEADHTLDDAPSSMISLSEAA
jgi:hypothetical protein